MRNKGCLSLVGNSVASSRWLLDKWLTMQVAPTDIPYKGLMSSTSWPSLRCSVLGGNSSGCHAGLCMQSCHSKSRPRLTNEFAECKSSSGRLGGRAGRAARDGAATVFVTGASGAVADDCGAVRCLVRDASAWAINASISAELAQSSSMLLWMAVCAVSRSRAQRPRRAREEEQRAKAERSRRSCAAAQRVTGKLRETRA